MIGKLKGIVDYIDKDNIIIDVGGVGYIVFCSSKVIESVPAVNVAITLIIETHVREDHINLYGFLSYSERDWFRALLTAKGVGTRVALAILGVLTPEKISIALAAKDRLAFTQISGIGPKLADRIIIELKDKIISSNDSTNSTIKTAFNSDQNIVQDALSALVNLGYNKIEAYNVANRLYSENINMNVGNLIKLALKELTK